MIAVATMIVLLAILMIEIEVLTAMHSVTGRPCYQTTGFPPVW